MGTSLLSQTDTQLHDAVQRQLDCDPEINARDIRFLGRQSEDFPLRVQAFKRLEGRGSVESMCRLFDRPFRAGSQARTRGSEID